MVFHLSKLLLSISQSKYIQTHTHHAQLWSSIFSACISEDSRMYLNVITNHFLFLWVCLPWVSRDGRLRHSCPDRAIDRPGATPESASKGCSSGGGCCCCCWVRKARYWKRTGRRNSTGSVFGHSLFMFSLHHYEVSLCCRTCVEFRTVHGSDHRSQLPSSWNEQYKKLQWKQSFDLQSLVAAQ